MMINLMQAGLDVQKIICDANSNILKAPTHDEVMQIKAGGKRVVHKPIRPCNCDAYAFPHRLDGGNCRVQYNLENGISNESSQADDDRLENALFDRAEAQAINYSR